MTSVPANSLTVEQYRRFYAEEIRILTGTAQPALVEAFARVPREKFLGLAPWRIAGEMSVQTGGYRETSEARDVYHNVLVALKSEKSLNNGQPSALASWIGALGLVEGNRVFHVGCGTGYYTAIMADVVGPTGKVVAAEVDADLAAQAAESLRPYANVTVHSGDGATFNPGLCDAILINAGVTHPNIPWLKALSEGGRMVLPLTVPLAPQFGRGAMVKITRTQDRFAAAVVSMVAIYSSSSVRDPELEPLLSKALDSRELQKMKSVRLDAHEQAESCIVHSHALCLSAERVAVSPA